MKPAINYADIFRGRVLIITGVGRSGTSLMGKILGSFTNTLYLYEPAILKYAPMYKDCDLEGIRGMIFEDYFAQQMACRNWNINEDEESYYGNYWYGTGIRTREQVLDCKPVFIIELFPECKVAHCIRNGNDVIKSSVKKGWYEDSYFDNVVDLMRSGASNATPSLHILDKTFYSNIKKNNIYTRCAHVWNRLMNAYEEYDLEHGSCFRYEELPEYKWQTIKLMKDHFNSEPTELTIRHFDSIREYKKSDSIAHKIQNPERGKFIDTMGKWGYEVT